jgi:four helix bundle protein
VDIEKQGQLVERLIKFNGRVHHLIRNLPRSQPNNNVISQISRSASSIGANYKEVCGSESIRDFLHKSRLCLKEAKETDYWLKVCREDNPQLANRMGALLVEAEEIVKIFGKIVSTTSKRLNINTTNTK